MLTVRREKLITYKLRNFVWTVAEGHRAGHRGARTIFDDCQSRLADHGQLYKFPFRMLFNTNESILARRTRGDANVNIAAKYAARANNTVASR